jgi:hypothetical protein
MSLGRRLGFSLATALAFQSKLIPALLAWPWLRRYRPRHVLAGVALGGALVLPYLGARQGLLRSLAGYAEYWRFNETLFAPLATLMGARAALALAAAVLVMLGVALAWRDVEAAPAALAIACAWLLLAPSVLPWYALWLLPLLVLVDAPGALLFTGTAALAYSVYPGWKAGGGWQVDWPVRALEYLPCLALGLGRWPARRWWPGRVAGAP